MSLPSSTIQELRNRFNPDGSLLRRHQLRMLDMLLEFDRLCRDHDLRYWLSSGTLIGALRHQGFIPWDDDMDVEMPHEDYLKMLSILPQHLPSWLSLQSHEQDPNFIFCYAKLRDRNSFLDEGLPYDRRCHDRGVYIDIFPVERHPIWLHRLSEFTFGHIYKICRTHPDDDKAFKRAVMLYRLNTRFIYPFFRLIARCLPSRMHALGMGIPYHSRRNPDFLYPLRYVPFEGHLLPVPNKSDELLRDIYGDYMQLPDLNKLAPHVAKLELE